jgi:hypothetical protein
VGLAGDCLSSFVRNSPEEEHHDGHEYAMPVLSGMYLVVTYNKAINDGIPSFPKGSAFDN